MKLITAEQLNTFKDLGKKLDVDKINPIIEQAQIDLREYLGNNLYFDVVANLENEEYQTLFSGGNFTIANQFPEVTYHHEGLLSMLADLFMARYIIQLNISINPFGATTKHSTDFEPADRNSLKDIAAMNTQMAGSKWEIIKMYLDANKSLFPIYNSPTSNTIATGERRLKFRKI